MLQTVAGKQSAANCKATAPGQLRNRAVVVRGTSGVGLAAAIELCRSGAQVWVTGRAPDKAMGAATAIGDRATGHAVDARDAVKLQDFFARVGEFDHLIVALGGGAIVDFRHEFVGVSNRYEDYGARSSGRDSFGPGVWCDHPGRGAPGARQWAGRSGR